MRILALEVEKQGVSAGDYQALLIEEARKVWQLYQDGLVGELYFRADKTLAVLMLECDDIKEARQKLSELPLVSANVIDFKLLPLIPYSGFSRLFESQCNG